MNTIKSIEQRSTFKYMLILYHMFDFLFTLDLLFLLHYVLYANNAVKKQQATLFRDVWNNVRTPLRLIRRLSEFNAIS